MLLHSLFFFFTALLVISSPLSLNAAEQPAAVPAASEQKAAAPATKEAGYDIVLVIDCSGSMKQTDPKDYRKEAARLFISLLGAEDRIAIVSLGDAAKTLIPLTANSRANRSQLFKAAQKISSKEYSTDITGALRKAAAELAASKRENRIIVLMSDGKLALGDPQKDEASTAELGKVLPEFSAAGVKIYTVAFSELSDAKLLAGIAGKTGGLFRYAKADSDIHVMFSSVFEKIKAPDSISLTGESFTIDKEIEEAVVLISKKQGTATQLINPAGRKITKAKPGSGVQWYGSAVFDMITLSKPAAGTWKVNLSTTTGNRIFVLTDLKLKTSFSAVTVSDGARLKIDAWLERDGTKITEKEVLEQVTFTADVSAPEGKTFKLPLEAATPNTGVYFADMSIAVPGEYSIRISAKGRTFDRSKDLHFNATEAEKVPAAAAATPQPEAAKPLLKLDDIDIEKSLMLGGGISAAVLLVMLLLMFGLLRYRKLYKNAKRQLATVRTTSLMDKALESRPEQMPDTARQEQASAEASAAMAESEKRINKLLGVIQFQQNSIAELAKIIEMLQAFRTKLGGLHLQSSDVASKIKSLAETNNISDEMSESVKALDAESCEIAVCVKEIEDAEHNFAEQFSVWEAKLKGMMEGEDMSPPAELSELRTKLTETVDMLNDREKQISDLKNQLESLDKEYMTLYHQQQAQQQPNQEI